MDNTESIESRFPFLSIMHPAHLAYIRHTPLNSLDYFFSVLDQVDARRRAESMALVFQLITRPEPGQSRDDDEAYETFKRECRRCAEVVADLLLITGLMQMTLWQLFDYGDTTATDQKQADLMALTESMLEHPGFQKVPEASQNLTSDMMARIEHVPERAAKGYALYEFFCEHVIAPLFDERRGSTGEQ